MYVVSLKYKLHWVKKISRYKIIDNFQKKSQDTRYKCI